MRASRKGPISDHIYKIVELDHPPCTPAWRLRLIVADEHRGRDPGRDRSGFEHAREHYVPVQHAPGMSACGSWFEVLEPSGSLPTAPSAAGTYWRASARGHVVDGKVDHYQVTLKIGFTLRA